MKLKNTLLLLAIIVVISSCDDRGIFAGGNVVTETRTVDTFTSIDVSVPANIFISQDTEQDIRIETHENIIGLVETIVINGELNIGFSRSLRNLRTLNIHITAADYERIGLSGAANLQAESCLTLDRLSLRSSGATKVELCGEANELDMRLSGASEFRGYDLETQTVRIVASGASNLRVRAEELLDVTASGASDIRYRGNPQVISDLSGASSLSNAN